MYYVLECILYNGNLCMLESAPDIEGIDESEFRLGQKITADVPEPIEFDLYPVDQGQMPTFFRNPYKIMKLDFLEALRGAGVDNIDTYQAVIRDPKTGKKWDDYAIANIIGVVEAVNMDESEFLGDRDSISVLFDKLVMDESRAHGLKMFRLAQSISTVLVSQEVKDYIEAVYPAKDIVFIRPDDEDYAG